jgi:hypothetical protein
MGTTSLEASYKKSVWLQTLVMFLLAIRELGKTFQLSRTPSRSSTSFHWSFSASKSMAVLVDDSWEEQGYRESRDYVVFVTASLADCLLEVNQMCRAHLE